MTSEVPDRRASIERHLQSIMLAVVTAAIFFAAKYIYDDNRAKALAQLQLELLTTQVIELRTEVRALQGNYIRRDDFRELEQRVRQLERQK